MCSPPSPDEYLKIIESVRHLVLEDHQLHCSVSDQYLGRFIKASRYDVQKSYQLIKDYFKSKRDHPEVFLFNLPSTYVTTISRLDLGFVIPEVNYKGRKVLLLRLGNINPYKESWYTLMQSATLVLETLSLEPEIQDSGVDLIFDCTNFSLKFMKWATPHKLRMVMRFLQDCIPMNFELFHVANAPLIFNVFYEALKPFMKDEFIKKLHWHKAPFKTLHKFVEPSVLPINLGGHLEDAEVSNWYEIILEKEEAFKEYFSTSYIK